MPFAQPFRVKCLLAAPLWDLEEHLMGVILVANKPDSFSEENVRQLDIPATQVAEVVLNDRLLNAERTRADQAMYVAKSAGRNRLAVK